MPMLLAPRAHSGSRGVGGVPTWGSVRITRRHVPACGWRGSTSQRPASELGAGLELCISDVFPRVLSRFGARLWEPPSKAEVLNPNCTSEPPAELVNSRDLGPSLQRQDATVTGPGRAQVPCSPRLPPRPAQDSPCGCMGGLQMSHLPVGPKMGLGGHSGQRSASRLTQQRAGAAVASAGSAGREKPRWLAWEPSVLSCFT